MQKDLFGTPSAAAMPDALSAKISFLDRYRMAVRLDQALFLLIGLLVIYVLVFSFGVETGKRYAMAEIKAERLKHERILDQLRDKVFAPVTAPVDASGPALATEATSSSSAKTLAQKTSAEPAQIPATVDSAVKMTIAGDSQNGKYTIQTMTIASKAVAEKEILRLAQKGMKGFIIPKGKMNMICVNAFESREKASRSLKELKTQRLVPSDAYVRPVTA